MMVDTKYDKYENVTSMSSMTNDKTINDKQLSGLLALCAPPYSQPDRKILVFLRLPLILS